MQGRAGLLVVNVDNLTTLPLRAVVQHHHETGATLTIACHREPFRIPFGQLILEGAEVVEYREKPAFPVMISSGVYAVGAQAAELIPTQRRFNINDLFQAVREHDGRISAFEHESKWIDINDPESLKRAAGLFGTAGPV